MSKTMSLDYMRWVDALVRHSRVGVLHRHYLGAQTYIIAFFTFAVFLDAQHRYYYYHSKYQ